MPTIFAASVENAEIFFTLLVILISAKVMAEIFERLGQPAVVGEILAGVAVGPSLFALVEPSQILTVLAEMGVIFLLFNVGLEIKPQAILQVGKRAFMVGVLGGLIPFAGGYLTAFFWSGSNIDQCSRARQSPSPQPELRQEFSPRWGFLIPKLRELFWERRWLTTFSDF